MKHNVKHAEITIVIDYEGNDNLAIKYLKDCAKLTLHKIRTVEYKKDIDVLQHYNSEVIIKDNGYFIDYNSSSE